MIDPKLFCEYLYKNSIQFFTGVPDTLLNNFCLQIDSVVASSNHVIAANEGCAIAIATGHYLATGNVPLVYMQNSGLGNATNPLLSLTNKEVYSIPIILLIGWRGAEDSNDWVQHHKQGLLTPRLLETIDIPYQIVEKDSNSAQELVLWAVEQAKKNTSPVALIIKKGVFGQSEKKDFLAEESEYPLTRENAIEHILQCLPTNTIYVATTGRASRELHAIRANNGQDHDKDVLNIGAMGHASSIALGIALAKPERNVVCLDGDAAFAMHMGSITTIGLSRPKNFLHIILNNGAHESVGGQLTAGFSASLTSMAEASGYLTTGCYVSTKNNIKQAIEQLKGNGPSFLDIRIRKGIRSDMPILRTDLGRIKDDFMNNLMKIK